MSGPTEKERTARALSASITLARRIKDDASSLAGSLGGVSPNIMTPAEYQRLRLLSDTVFFLMDEIRKELVGRLDVLDGYEKKFAVAKVPTLFRAARRSKPTGGTP